MKDVNGITLQPGDHVIDSFGDMSVITEVSELRASATGLVVTSVEYKHMSRYYQFNTQHILRKISEEDAILFALKGGE